MTTGHGSSTPRHPRDGNPPWPLTHAEQANARLIADAVGEVALLYVTPTQLVKSIMDANASVRTLFAQSGFHSYDDQAKGPAARVTHDAVIAHNLGLVETKVSLYRPETKNGDPRLWFSKAGSVLRPHEVLALFVGGQTVYAASLSTSTLYEGGAPELRSILDGFSVSRLGVAKELLDRLYELAATGPHPAQGSGDTAVGRTLEWLLGIQRNSSKAPDYKGIELKSARRIAGAGRPRSNLFARVPDWGLSHMKSSDEIVRAFGYKRPGRPDELLRLYCTLCVGPPNSQGLRLKMDPAKGLLEEVHLNANRVEPVVAWRLMDLHAALKSKHAETFWVDVDSVRSPQGSTEHFHFRKVTYTRAPSAAMFDAQLASGSITVDHLIKLKGSAGLVVRAQEKGPLFKIRKSALHLLFPAEKPIVWSLAT